MIIKRESMFTGKVHYRDINVTYDQLADWRNGTLIQNAMPDLTPDEREFIMTGVTSEEWDETFHEDN